LKKNLTHKKFQRGFNLIEVVLLLAVVGIMASGIIPLFIYSISVNKSSEYYSIAYKKLDSKVEEYRELPFDELSSETFQISELPEGQGVLTVTDVIEGAPQTDIKSIKLVITWNFKRSQEIKSVTYVSREGLKR